MINTLLALLVVTLEHLHERRRGWDRRRPVTD